MAATPKPKPKAKPKGLNDFLKEGKTPPSKNKKLPSDADVTLKGYNDKKTIAKEKLKADMKSGKMKRTESGMTGAMVAKVAGKVISKVVSKAAKKTATAVPSKIVVKGGSGSKPISYQVNKTPTGKIKLTTRGGNTVTFPKGTTAPKIATRMQEGNTLFGNKGVTSSLRGKTGRTK